MKTLIASAIALTLAAPAFAQVDNVQAYLAQSNESAAEQTVSETSQGDINEALTVSRASKVSPAEKDIMLGGNDIAAQDETAIQAFFGMFKDSAAEQARF